MIHYETFESSSGDEMSRCIFESQALSFQNKDKVVSSKEKEQKRIERLKRKLDEIRDRACSCFGVAVRNPGKPTQ